MNTMEPTALLETLNWRYATKQFDPTRKIPDDVWSALESALVLSPSSYGLQPWQFFVVTDPSVKAALRPHSWDQPQVTDCSHHVVFATRNVIDADYAEKFLTHTAAVRGIPIESLAFYRDMITCDVINGPRSKWVSEWAARQVYIALGVFMTAAALMGVDTCPMEGMDPAKYDEILGLPEKGFKSVVACPAGYRAEGDKYAKLPKVRFDKSELVQYI